VVTSLGENNSGYLIHLVKRHYLSVEGLSYFGREGYSITIYCQVNVVVCATHKPIAYKAADNIAVDVAIPKELSQLI